MAKRGNPVYVCGGKYVGLHGWFNKAAVVTHNKVGVILVLDQAGNMKATKIKRFHVRHPHKLSNYAEGVIAKQPKIEAAMGQVCSQLAKCSVEKRDIKDLSYVFEKKMKRAIERQEEKGSRARYRKVQFTRPPQKHPREDANEMHTAA